MFMVGVADRQAGELRQRLALEVEGPPIGPFPGVDLREQVLDIGSQEVDHRRAHLHRVGGGHAGSLEDRVAAHSTLRPWRSARSAIVAALVLLTLSARVSGRSSPPLPTTDAAPIVVEGAMAATSPARVMKVAALRGLGARGRHVGDHRDAAAEDGGQDALHAGQLTARRVDLDEHGRGLALGGGLDPLLDVGGVDLVDHAAEAEAHHVVARRERGHGQREGTQQQGGEGDGSPQSNHSPSIRIGRSDPLRRPQQLGRHELGPRLEPLPRRRDLVGDAIRPLSLSTSRTETGRPAASTENTTPRWTDPTGFESSFSIPTRRKSGSQVCVELLRPFASQAHGQRVHALVDRVQVTADADARLAVQARVAAGIGPFHEEDPVGVPQHDVGNELLPLRRFLGQWPVEVASVICDSLPQEGQLSLVSGSQSSEVAPTGHVLTRKDEDLLRHRPQSIGSLSGDSCPQIDSRPKGPLQGTRGSVAYTSVHSGWVSAPFACRADRCGSPRQTGRAAVR